MAQRAVLGSVVAVILALVAGCAGSSSQDQNPYTPHIDPAHFTTTIDNEYFPLEPGTIFLYKGAQSATR